MTCHLKKATLWQNFHVCLKCFIALALFRFGTHCVFGIKHNVLLNHHEMNQLWFDYTRGTTWK